MLISALNVWGASVLGAPSFHADVHAGNLLVRWATSQRQELPVSHCLDRLLAGARCLPMHVQAAPHPGRMHSAAGAA